MSIWTQSEPPARKRERAKHSTWIKLANDGDKARVVFLSETIEREFAFIDGKYALWNESFRAEGHRPLTRFASNVALYPSREVQVLEQGVAFHRELSQLRKQLDTLDGKVFELERHGAAKDPKTTYTITLLAELTPHEQRVYAALPQHDLLRLYPAPTQPSGDTPQQRCDRTALVDPVTANAMSAVLRALPMELAQRFYRRFSVKRVRELAASKIEAAATLLEELETEHHANTSQAFDPFV